ncbi:MAG: GTPase Era [Clostridiales bacterium]|nr:GTPase Era [Clostridiales bacterium]MDY2835943.1 GTPase Era [Candidatus Aphodomonas sp.]
MSFHSGFIAIVGRPNVGKSTLMNAFVGEKVAIVSDKPQTTRNRIMGVATGAEWQMVFLDTPGLHTPRTKLGEYMMKSANDALDGIDALLVMIDGSACGPQDRQIVERMAQIRSPKALVINKVDLMTPQTLAPLLASLNIEGYDEIIPISARRGDSMDKLKETLIGFLPEGPKYFPDDMITDQPERLLCAEIIREKALRNLRDEVPHGIGVEMQRIEKLSDNLTEIHATIYCERESHKRIIIGKQGTMLGRIGSQAREDIEKLLGTHVSLKLWVKIREDWRNRNDDLRTLGYE